MNNPQFSKKQYYLLIYLLLGWLTVHGQKEIFFSEYIEDGRNKCLELFNPTNKAIDLSSYTIEVYINGSSTSVGTPWSFSGRTIGPLSVMVLCQGLSDVTLLSIKDYSFGFGSFNGDDAILLKNNGRVIDIIGKVGCDPGTSWSGGNNKTENVVLVRNACVNKGITNSGGSCNTFRGLESDWKAYSKTDYSHLGKHTFGLVGVKIFGKSALCEQTEITLTATKGHKTYKWSNGSNSAATTITSSGTYTVTVTTAQNCKATASKRIKGQSPKITAEIKDIQNVSCLPKSDGGFTVAPSGGSGKFTYEWETGASTAAIIRGVAAGDYQVTVMDNNGCSTVKEVTVGGLPTFSMNVTQKGETCIGRGDGSINISTSESGIQYSLNGGAFQNNSFFDKLLPGSYNVLAIDNSGCGNQKKVVISGGTRFDLRDSRIAQAKCQGSGGGQIFLVPKGGKKPYEVSFNGRPFTKQTVFSDLKGDTYDIIVRDASGCEKSFEQIIEDGSDLLVTDVQTTPATCKGINDGVVNLTTTGGTAGFISINAKNPDGSYSIPKFGREFRDLAMGTYRLYAIDNKFGCEIPFDFEITEKLPLLTSVLNSAPCRDEQKGSITVLPQTGIAPFQYRLDTSDFVDTNVFLDLDPMNYVVTTKDSLGCIKIDSVDFVSAVNFEIQSAIPSAESCTNYEDGKITVSTNSTNGVQYSLDDINYVESPVFSGLKSGDYTVYAKSDACRDSATVTILPAAPIVLDKVEQKTALCEEGNDGQLTINISGGKRPYAYKLDDGLYQTNNVFVNLIQGTYTLTVRDSKLCEQTFTDIALAGPVRLEVDCVVTQQVSTKDGNDGAVSVKIAGGASPYNVQLVDAGFNNVITATGLASFENLPVGDYTVKIEDKNDCVTTCNFTIKEPRCDFSIDKTQSDATCFEISDGKISLVLPTENAPFTINWTDSQYNGQQQITSLAAGIYGVTVTDQADCIDSLMVSITEPPALSVEIIADNLTICEGDTAQLTLTDSYSQYNWSNNSTNATTKIYEEGTYQVTVRNGDGCVATDNIVINVIAQDTVSDTRYTCDESSIGTFAVAERNIDGCMDIVFRTFELARRDTTLLRTMTCNPIDAGVVTRRLINAFGCDSLVITETISTVSEPTNLTTTTCNTADVGIDTFLLTNQFLCDSLVVINTILAPSDFLSLNEQSCNPLDTGLVIQHLSNQFECDSTVEIRTTLYAINDCLLDFSLIADTICWDAIRGTIQLAITEGIPPFNYYILNDFWRDTIQRGVILTSDEETILTDIPVGQYSIFLVNDRKVLKEKRIAVTQTNEMIIDGLFSDYGGFAVSCEGQADGRIDLAIINGQTPYTYLWENGEQTEHLQNLSIGNYKVTVTDAGGCQQQTTFDLFSTSEMQIDFQSFSPKCFGDAAGSITIYDLPNANGMVEYSLDGVFFQPIDALPFTIENLTPNDYQLFVQDENDCQASAFFSVPISIEHKLTLGGNKNLTLGDGLTIIPKANFEIDRFEWTATVALACEDCLKITTIPTQNGVYTLTAYDANGCKVTKSIAVNLRKESQVYLPNAFSPNGDGNNDVYEVLTGNSVSTLKSLRIFDYEGRLMYQVNNRPPNDAAVGWNGLFNGQKMLPAVFVVFVEVELLDGTSEVYRQTMTLVE